MQRPRQRHVQGPPRRRRVRIVGRVEVWHHDQVELQPLHLAHAGHLDPGHEAKLPVDHQARGQHPRQLLVQPPRRLLMATHHRDVHPWICQLQPHQRLPQRAHQVSALLVSRPHQRRRIRPARPRRRRGPAQHLTRQRLDRRRTAVAVRQRHRCMLRLSELRHGRRPPTKPRPRVELLVPVARHRHAPVRRHRPPQQLELDRRQLLRLVEQHVLIASQRPVPRRIPAGDPAMQREHHREVLAVDRLRQRRRRPRVERLAVEGLQALAVDMRQRVLRRPRKLHPRVRQQLADHLLPQLSIRRRHHPPHQHAIAVQVQQQVADRLAAVAIARPDLAHRRRPRDDLREHRAQRRMALELRHRRVLRRRHPPRQLGEQPPGLPRRPLGEGRDRHPGHAELRQAAAHQPSQPRRRHDHQRPEAPPLRLRRPGQARQAVQRHRRLAEAGLAEHQQRALPRQLHRRALHLVEHHRRRRQRPRLQLRRPRLQPHPALLRDPRPRRRPPQPTLAPPQPHQQLAVKLDQVPTQHRPPQHPPVVLELVVVADLVREEHRRQRRGLPVDPRREFIDPRPTREQHVAHPSRRPHPQPRDIRGRARARVLLGQRLLLGDQRLLLDRQRS